MKLCLSHLRYQSACEPLKGIWQTKTIFLVARLATRQCQNKKHFPEGIGKFYYCFCDLLCPYSQITTHYQQYAIDSLLKCMSLCRMASIIQFSSQHCRVNRADTLSSFCRQTEVEKGRMFCLKTRNLSPTDLSKTLDFWFLVQWFHHSITIGSEACSLPNYTSSGGKQFVYFVWRYTHSNCPHWGVCGCKKLARFCINPKKHTKHRLCL